MAAACVAGLGKLLFAVRALSPEKWEGFVTFLADLALLAGERDSLVNLGGVALPVICLAVLRMGWLADSVGVGFGRWIGSGLLDS